MFHKRNAFTWKKMLDIVISFYIDFDQGCLQSRSHNGSCSHLKQFFKAVYWAYIKWCWRQAKLKRRKNYSPWWWWQGQETEKSLKYILSQHTKYRGKIEFLWWTTIIEHKIVKIKRHESRRKKIIVNRIF